MFVHCPPRATLNQAIRSLELGIRDFVIHDFRRTASTQLHEAGFNGSLAPADSMPCSP